MILTAMIENSGDITNWNFEWNILTKDFTPTLNTSTKYTIPFSNPLYNPHSGHNSDAGGILESSGFKISGGNKVNRYYSISERAILLHKEAYCVNIFFPVLKPLRVLSTGM